MKSACVSVLVFVLPYAAMAQLLGFGASCPTIKVKVTNVNIPVMINLLAVAHSPQFGLIDDKAEADLEILRIMACPNDPGSNEDFPCEDGGELDENSFGVSRSPYVCGGEDKGFVYVDLDDEAVLFGDSYQDFYLRPENSASCNCGDMRISIVAEQYVPVPILHDLEELNEGTVRDGNFHDLIQASIVYLNGHELPSTTHPSHVRAPTLMAPCIVGEYVNDQVDGVEVELPCTLIYGATVVLETASMDAALIEFTPSAGSSASFLSLWALLMGGWW